MLMARACYNPEKAAEVWERFERVMPQQAEFLSTHPTPKNRKKNLQVNSSKFLLSKIKLMESMC
jgi:predicted Zn-dependent protease